VLLNEEGDRTFYHSLPFDLKKSIT